MGAPRLASGDVGKRDSHAARLQQFHNCCTPKPPLPSGIFLKKMTPFAELKRARELWNCSNSASTCLQLKSTLMTEPTHAQQLLALLARTSFRLGQFKLSSGGTSDYYIDCRTTTLHAEGGRLTGHAILDLLEANHIDAEAVGGLTMGADPIVSNVATASAQHALSGSAQSDPQARLLHGFLVRKAEKAHGTGRRIEGFCREGARVVIVDDVCTTGASTINAIEAAHEAGMKVVAVVCIVEREEANGRPAVEAAAQGAPFLRLFTANDVRAEHVKELRPANR